MNSSNVIGQIASLAGTLLVALLVWRYYRTKKFPAEMRYRTFGPRFWTGSIDSCVFLPLTITTTFLLWLNIPSILAVILVIVQNLAWLVYTVLMHAHYGQTIGKMVTKVRVVDSRTEGKISWLQATVREGIPLFSSLGLEGYEVFEILSGRVTARGLANGEAYNNHGPFWLLTAIPGIWFFAEVLTMLTNKKRRALHDIIAGTVVVRTNLDYDNEPSKDGIDPGTASAPQPVI